MSVVLIISGPAGSGKTTLCERMVAAFPRVQRFVTSTTRNPRPGEQQGVDYHFLSPADFEAAIQRNDFIEWARVHGRLYGSQSSHLQAALAADVDLLFNIDVQGAATLRSLLPKHLPPHSRLASVFIKPTSIQQITERLLHRGTDGPDEIQRRLQSATAELAHADRFDHVIPSGSREDDFQALKAFYLSLR